MDVFEMVVTYSQPHDPYRGYLNQLCSHAISCNKTKFVISLIRRGATPPPNQLPQVPGVLDDDTVQKYLEGVSAAVLKEESGAQAPLPPLKEEESIHRVCSIELEVTECVNETVAGDH